MSIREKAVIKEHLWELLFLFDLAIFAFFAIAI